MKLACQEVVSPRIAMELNDKPLKTSQGCSWTPGGQQGHDERRRVGAFKNDVDRHEVVPGFAAKPNISLFFSAKPGSSLQGHTINTEVKRNPRVPKSCMSRCWTMRATP